MFPDRTTWREVTKPISSVPFFPNFSALAKRTLTIENHVYVWQVSPQLSCGSRRWGIGSDIWHEGATNHSLSKWWPIYPTPFCSIMMSWHGGAFGITGPLCGDGSLSWFVRFYLRAITYSMIMIPLWHGHLSPKCSQNTPGVGVTKAPFANFSVTGIFYLAKV